MVPTENLKGQEGVRAFLPSDYRGFFAIGSILGSSYFEVRVQHYRYTTYRELGLRTLA